LFVDAFVKVKDTNDLPAPWEQEQESQQQLKKKTPKYKLSNNVPFNKANKLAVVRDFPRKCLSTEHINVTNYICFYLAS
jgi:hypothetical protein